MGKRPPNDLTADEWGDMRKAVDQLDMMLGAWFNGKATFDTQGFIAALTALETIRSTINLVLGPQGEDDD